MNPKKTGVNDQKSVLSLEGGMTSKKTYKKEKPVRVEKKLESFGRVGQWFQTLCWMNIPVIGFCYILVLAIRKKTPEQKRSFAIAYILYRILILLLALTILFVLYKVGLSFVDEILRYAGSTGK